MERMGIAEMRVRIGEYLAKAIGVSANETDSKKFGAAVRQFVEEKLEIKITNEGSHKAYAGYSDRSAHSALRKILKGYPAFQAGAKRDSLCAFEDALIRFVIREKILGSQKIYPQIFRDVKSEERNELFASYRYLRKHNTQAEYICRRFLDKFSSSREDIFDLRSEDNCGIALFAIVETSSEQEKILHKLTFCDVFDQGQESPFDPLLKRDGWQFSRICPPGKPTISVASTVRDLKRVYISESENEKSKNNYLKIQQISQQNILRFLVNQLFESTIKINQKFSNGLWSGPLKRVVFDVEIGAVIAGQIDHGRFWFFAFCPIESKVRQSDALVNKVVEHYQGAVKKR